MKHRTFWAIFILGVLLVSGFAGLFTLAAGAPGSNPARAPASDTPVGDSGLQSFLAVPILEVHTPQGTGASQHALTLTVTPHATGDLLVVVVYANDFQNVGTITLSVAGVSLTSIAATWTAVQNQSVTNYTLVYSTVGPNGPFTGRVSEGSSLSATISSLAPDTTYWLRVWAWDSGTLVLMSNVGPAQTLSPIPPAPVIPVSLTIPQVVVISTFMALIVAGLIAAGTRKKKRNRNGYPMSD